MYGSLSRVRTPAAHQGGIGDLNDDHLDQELDLGTEQVAGVTDGGVFLQAVGEMQVGHQRAAFRVTRQRSSPDGFDVAQLNGIPDRGRRITQTPAGADQVD
ncbi:MAG TPA: hypothetical protein VFP72_04515 [Kineosporiaceae bacterium]|nr:hypothetical protein [Kineosporiaceae bacterium]